MARKLYELGIDLHTHSTASDGTESPINLVKMAVSSGIGVLALTDHDTVSGVQEALKASANLPITFVPGLEISANSTFGHIHVLGLGLNKIPHKMQTLLENIQNGRRERNPKIIRKLNTLGYKISMSDVTEMACGDIIGRPHIAKALVKNGYFAVQEEAFAKLLKHNAPAYVQRWRPSVKEAVDTILACSAVPIIAHPGLLDVSSNTSLRSIIRNLKDDGIMGLEVHYTMHSASQHKELDEISENFDMIPTGGSDFHGDNNHHAKLGHGTAGLPIGHYYADKLMDYLNIQWKDKTP
ncbi:PHP domain-containing protein [bacterium]|nr:PHP domain-containing protein [candidate division CSSED10-310 bacterium]